MSIHAFDGQAYDTGEEGATNYAAMQQVGQRRASFMYLAAAGGYSTQKWRLYWIGSPTAW